MYLKSVEENEDFTCPMPVTSVLDMRKPKSPDRPGEGSGLYTANTEKHCWCHAAQRKLPPYTISP